MQSLIEIAALKNPAKRDAGPDSQKGRAEKDQSEHRRAEDARQAGEEEHEADNEHADCPEIGHPTCFDATAVTDKDAKADRRDEDNGYAPPGHQHEYDAEQAAPNTRQQ